MNNFGPAFKIYLTVVKNSMQKVKQFAEDKILFKVIEEKETRIKAEDKASANFAATKSKLKLKVESLEKKKSLLNDKNK